MKYRISLIALSALLAFQPARLSLSGTMSKMTKTRRRK